MGNTGSTGSASIDISLHSAACFACRHISGLKYDWAVSIISAIPDWKSVPNDRILKYVKHRFWNSPEFTETINNEDDDVTLRNVVDAVCCEISGLNHETARQIIANHQWKAMNFQTLISRVRTAWDKSKRSLPSNHSPAVAEFSEVHHSNSAYMSQAARESRRFTWMKNNPVEEQPKEPSRRGENRGSRIGDLCRVESCASRTSRNEDRVWRQYWLRAWSTLTEDGEIRPVAIVEDVGTGECHIVAVADIVFE